MALYKVNYGGLDEKYSDRYMAKERSEMHFAASRGQLMVLYSLIRNGASVNRRTSMGYTPLHDACWTNHPYCASHLIKSRAQVGAMTSDGKTPLVLASSVGSKDCIKILLDSRAKVNVEDESCVSAVHAAAVAGQREALDLLIAAGGNINSRNPYYGSPLHAACGGPSIECAALLIASGAIVNSVRKRDHHTPLHVAALVESPPLIDLLVCNGADIHARDREGRKPIDLAPKDSPTYGLLQKYMANPESLTSLCRNQIRTYLGGSAPQVQVRQLNLPHSLQEYLTFTERSSSSGE